MDIWEAGLQTSYIHDVMGESYLHGVEVLDVFLAYTNPRTYLINVTRTHFKRDSYHIVVCLLYTSPSPRDLSTSRMPSSA